MPFGAFIRKKREEKNIQMNEFARQLEISPAYLSVRIQKYPALRVEFYPGTLAACHAGGECQV